MSNANYQNKLSHLQRGILAEQQACDYLIAQGLTLVCRNFRCQYGELDLVMQDQEVLVIVEVRFRRSEAFGGAIGSITAQKKAKIIAACQWYLMTYAIDSPVRFDVIAISPSSGITWIANAFNV